MTQERIAEIKELCEQATPGPWFPCGCRYTMISRELNDQEIEDVAEVCNHFRDESQIQYNKLFISESRTIIPELLTAYENAMKALEKCKEQREGWCRIYHKHAAMYYKEEPSEASVTEDMFSDDAELDSILKGGAEMSEKEFSDESDYEGMPVDEVIRDAIAWEKSANEWRKIVDRLKTENERLWKALYLAKEQRNQLDSKDEADYYDAAINEILDGNG